MLALVAHRQLAVTRAQIGLEGSVEAYPARVTFDPTQEIRGNPLSRLRDLPDDTEYARVRVVALHLRNVGPLAHRVNLAASTAKIGENPRKDVTVLPAWGPHDSEYQVPLRDFVALPPAQVADFVLYLIGDWYDEREARLKLQLVIGGDERVPFDRKVVLWKLKR